MCLPSQQTRETKGGDEIAKTQTQTFPFEILDAVVSTTERDNE